MTVTDGGVPAVYSAAEHVHQPQVMLEFIDVDNGKSGVYCKTCMVQWPCQPILNYRREMRKLYADKAAEEETVVRSQDG